MNSFDTQRIIYLLLILIIFVPGWWAVSGTKSEKLRNALIWFAIIVALMLGWAAFHPQSFPIPLKASDISHDI